MNKPRPRDILVVFLTLFLGAGIFVFNKNYGDKLGLRDRDNEENITNLAEQITESEVSVGLAVEPLKTDAAIINYPYTDENEGETLIIKTDRKTYHGFTNAPVYFSVTNSSAYDEKIALIFYFAKDNGEVNRMSRWDGSDWRFIDFFKENIKINENSLNEGLSKRNQIPDTFTAKAGTEIEVPAGKTAHFNSVIAYSPESEGEFWIEAIGKNGGYGLLDPLWVSVKYGTGSATGVENYGIPNAFPDYAVIGLVREDCTGYDNCFTSLSSWESNYGGVSFTGCTSGDLTCAKKIAVAKIDGAWNAADSAVSIAGWTTGAKYYIQIYTTAAARHKGKWDTNKYRVVSYNTSALVSNEDYVRIDGLQLQTPAVDANGDETVLLTLSGSSGASDLRFSNSIVRNDPNNTSFNCRGINVNIATVPVTFYIWNTIVYDVRRGGITSAVQFSAAAGTAYVYNVTGADGANTFRNATSGGVAYIKNSYFGNGSTASYAAVAGATNNLTTSASSDTTGSLGLQNIAYSTANFTNLTSGSYDLHLTHTSALKDVGTSIINEPSPLNFTNDIDRQTRWLNAWDIGADELYTATPPPIKIKGGVKIK